MAPHMRTIPACRRLVATGVVAASIVMASGAMPGIAASSGVVEGRARVILSLGEAYLSDGDIQLRAEEISTGPVGFTVPQFAGPVFRLAGEGAVSGVVETRFGFHVIFLEKIMPARHVPLEQVASELRAGLWPEVRKREFARFIDGLAASHKVQLHPELLDEGAAP